MMQKDVKNQIEEVKSTNGERKRTGKGNGKTANKRSEEELQAMRVRAAEVQQERRQQNKDRKEAQLEQQRKKAEEEGDTALLESMGEEALKESEPEDQTQFDEMGEEELLEYFKDTQEYLALYKSNEEIFETLVHDTTLTEYQRAELMNKIAADNIKTVYYVVNKYSAFAAPRDELISAGMTGYAKALANYDPNRTAKFATFAINCIRNEIQYCLRKEYRHYKNNVSLNATKHTDKNGNDLSLEDTLADDAENGADIVNNEALRGIIKNELRELQPVERYVITYRFGLDRGTVFTQNEIADITDMSQANISKIEKNALIKLKSLLNEAF